jgi:phosphoribosylformylglycinamidine synthase
MHDISDGGLVINLIESLNSTNDFGCDIKMVDSSRLRKDFLCFGESQSRVIISCNPKHLAQVFSIFNQSKIDASQIGIVTSESRLKIGSYIDIDVVEAINRYNNAIENKMPVEQN